MKVSYNLQTTVTFANEEYKIKAEMTIDKALRSSNPPYRPNHFVLQAECQGTVVLIITGDENGVTVDNRVSQEQEPHLFTSDDKIFDIDGLLHYGIGIIRAGLFGHQALL